MNRRTSLCLVVTALLLASGPAAAQTCGGNSAGCGKSASAKAGHCHWLEVKSVVPDGPAAAAGVEAGDVLVSYAGSTVGCLADLNRAKESATADSIVITFRRGDKNLNFVLPKGKLGIYFNEWQKDLLPDQGAKVVKGVPALGWLEGKSNSFMGALDAVLQQQGVKRDYPYLCGVSGAAFRTHFFDTWCPSSPDATCGFDASAEALAAVGLKAEWLFTSSDGKNKPQIVTAIKKSIDAGMPVLAIDLITMPEWGVVTGYQKGGSELFCRTYFDKRKGYELAQKFPFAVAVLKKLPNVPGEVASMRRSFRTVVENLSSEKYEQYFSGLAAYDKWIERLRTDDFSKLDSAGLSNVVQANYWIYDRIVTDRQTGLAYLAWLASEMPEYSAKAADLTALYEQEVKVLDPLRAELPCPGSVTTAADWTREIRDKEIAALTKARGFEAQALPMWKELASAK